MPEQQTKKDEKKVVDHKDKLNCIKLTVIL